MKKLFILWLLLILSNLIMAQSEFIEKQVSVTIDRDHLIQDGYDPTRKSDDPSEKQPLTSKKEIENFLFKVNKENSAKTGFDVEISSWLTQNLTSYANDATIIFVRHPLKLDNLFDQSSTGIATDYTAACTNYTLAKTNLELFSKQSEEISKLYKDNIDAVELIKAEGGKINAKEKKTLRTKLKENEGYASSLYKLRGLIDSYNKEMDLYFAKKETLQKNYNSARNYFVEDTTQVLTTILSKENYSYSDYILNKKNVMVILLGSFKSYQLQFTNKEKRVNGEAKDIALIIKSVAGINMGDFSKESGPACSPKDPGEAALPLTLILMNRSKIEAPSSIEFKNSKGEIAVLSEIHERSYIGVKVGVSLSNVDNKNFNLNPNNQLTITPDSLNSKDIKANLMALLEIYPFGRDYDRLKVITASDNIPFYERLGIVGGVKISKDPLETIFAGLSLAISKEINIVGGMAFTKIAKDVTNLDVGYNKTIDYLRANANKEYTPKFYIGFSLSPSQLFKSLGITK